MIESISFIPKLFLVTYLLRIRVYCPICGHVQPSSGLYCHIFLPIQKKGIRKQKDMDVDMTEPKKITFIKTFVNIITANQSLILYLDIAFMNLLKKNFFFQKLLLQEGQRLYKKQPNSAPSCFFTYFLPSHFTTIFYEYVIMKIFWLAEDFLPSLELFELAQENMDVFFSKPVHQPFYL